MLDRKFLEKLREGDPAAEQLFVTHFGRLLMLKLRMNVRAYNLLEDIRQEALMRAIVAIRKGSVQQPEKLGGYVSAVADHVLLEMIRERGRVEDCRIPETADDRFDVDRELFSAERALEVRKVIAELPPRQRDIIRLVFLDGIGRDEVCRRFNLTPDQLRVVVHRAVSKLRGSLQRKKIGTD